MDTWTENHLDQWLERAEHPEYRDTTKARILALLASDPTLLDSHGWPELRDMAETAPDMPSMG